MDYVDYVDTAGHGALIATISNAKVDQLISGKVERFVSQTERAAAGSKGKHHRVDVRCASAISEEARLEQLKSLDYTSG